MPSRRRKTSTGKLSASAGAVPKEEEKEDATPRPVVTQVVEVIEEEIPVTSMEAPPPSQTESERQVEEAPMSAPEEETTRKERVEELYQKAPDAAVMPEISVHNKKPVTSIFVWAIVTILVAILTGGVLFAVAKKASPGQLFARPTPTPTPTSTPTPTPTVVKVDKTSFEIQVLNGGGTVGAASKMKTFLEGKGYTVSGTGNTADYTYTSTEIHGKPTMKDAIANLQADLKDTYTIGSVAADLSASASADVQVIVGK